MNETFGKNEKLKSKKEIELLFSDGSSVSQYPIRLVYRKTSFENNVVIRAGVSVGKRNFKKAVDRNKIKRLLREGYRKNKHIVISNNTEQFAFMLIYIGKEIPDYKTIETKIPKLLQKFVDGQLKTKN